MIVRGVDAQSLADVARKAEEARAKRDQANPDDKETERAPVRKVFTNADLKDAPAPATAPGARKTEVPAKDTPNKTTEKPGEPARDEAWWRTRMAGLRASVDQTTAACVPKAALLASLERAIEIPPPPAYTISSHELAKARARTDLGTCLALIDAAKAAVGAAEEEGRRAGVLPGWLR
jgi:hypothetical protein